jgi:hypothetical protein
MAIDTKLNSTPFEASNDIRIKIVNTYESAIALRDEGWTPVECSFGDMSVVNEFKLDHHGPYRELEGVAIRAYRDLFAKLKHDPKFVVTGFPDEDATFAICSLAGIIPHPSFAGKFPSAPENVQIVSQMDLTSIAILINDVDLDPNLALSLIDSYRGRIVLSWRQQGHKNCRDKLAWYGGIDRWRTILTSQNSDFINAAIDSQVANIEKVLKANAQEISERVVVVDFSNLGPNSIYYRVWLDKYPILVAYMGSSYNQGNCSFAVSSSEKAKELLGKRGLINVYQHLYPGDCGGREIIGGSSRTLAITWDEACNYGRQIENYIKLRTA